VPWYTNALPEGAFATKDDLLNGGRRTVLRGEPVLRSSPGAGRRAAAVLTMALGRPFELGDKKSLTGRAPGRFVADGIAIATRID
jgi:hypothetical protein